MIDLNDVKAVEERLQEPFLYKFEYSDDVYETEGDDWYEVKEAAHSVTFIEGLGLLELVEDFGGEGQGDQYWFVIRITQGDVIALYRMDGYYASYDGGYYDGGLYRVKPQAKIITEYVRA